MPVKTYLRYKLQDTFGVINTPGVDLINLPSSDGRIVISASLEDISFWNIRQGILVDVLRDPENKSVVTCLALDPQGINLAAGYANGSIRLWNLAKKEISTVFTGHNGAVTALRYEASGHILISGSKDTEIIVWDVVAEQGQFRLKGHKDEITDINFLAVSTQIPKESTPSEEIQRCQDAYLFLSPDYTEKTITTTYLVTSSKDSTVKFWDLQVQHCAHTISSQSGEVWSFDILPLQPTTTQTSQQEGNLDSTSTLLVTGSTDKFLRTWRLRTNLVAPSHATERAVLDSLFEHTGIEFCGVIDRMGGTKRVSRVRFSFHSHDDAKQAAQASSRNQSHVLCVFGIDKCLDIYRVRNVQDKAQRQKRRFKRYKDKLADITQRIQEKKLPQSALAEAEKDMPPLYLPSDDLETCVPIRTEDRITNFVFLHKQPVNVSKVAYEQLYQAGQVKKLSPYTAPTEALTLTSYCGFSNNTIQQCTFNLAPIVKLQNESLNMMTQKDGGNGSENKLYNEDLATYKVKQTLSTAGHRDPVRFITLSSDDSLLLSVGGDEMKFWNMKTHSCLRTINLFPTIDEKTGEALKADQIVSCVFVPGNKHILVGTKNGFIDLYEIASGLLLNREQGEPGQPIWALDMSPDGKFFATSCGKQVWFWELEMVEITKEELEYFSAAIQQTGAHTATLLKRKKLTFSQTRALQLTDEVLCMRHSPDGRYIAVGLLDSTVRIFHTDTLNFFLSLYGHKLPVTSIDISDDSTLVLTGSSDKTVKIWGIDFGDCRRSMHAHDNSIMRVRFQPETHFFFTVGKDFQIKYWDADRHKRLMSLPPHHSEVLSLAISSNGRYIVTCANDRSIKRFYQTDEAFIPDEEDQEELLEEMVDGSAENYNLTTASTANTSQRIGQVAGGVASGLSESEEVWAKTLRSKDVISLTEYLLDALENCKNEIGNWEKYHLLVQKTRQERMEKYLKEKDLLNKAKTSKKIESTSLDLSHLTAIQRLQLEQAQSKATASAPQEEAPLDASDLPQPSPNPIFMGKTPSQYMLSIIRVIKPTNLQTVLISLPFDYAVLLIQLLASIVKQGNELELCTKCILFILKIHQQQLITTMNKSYIELLQLCRDNMRIRLHAHRNMIGLNLSALQYLQSYIEEVKAMDTSLKTSLHKIAEEDIDKILGRSGKKDKKHKYTTKAHKKQRTGTRRLVRRVGGSGL